MNKYATREMKNSDYEKYLDDVAIFTMCNFPLPKYRRMAIAMYLQESSISNWMEQPYGIDDMPTGDWRFPVDAKRVAELNGRKKDQFKLV